MQTVWAQVVPVGVPICLNMVAVWFVVWPNYSVKLGSRDCKPLEGEVEWTYYEQCKINVPQYYAKGSSTFIPSICAAFIKDGLQTQAWNLMEDQPINFGFAFLVSRWIDVEGVRWKDQGLCIKSLGVCSNAGSSRIKASLEYQGDPFEWVVRLRYARMW